MQTKIKAYCCVIIVRSNWLRPTRTPDHLIGCDWLETRHMRTDAFGAHEKLDVLQWSDFCEVVKLSYRRHCWTRRGPNDRANTTNIVRLATVGARLFAHRSQSRGKTSFAQEVFLCELELELAWLIYLHVSGHCGVPTSSVPQRRTELLSEPSRETFSVALCSSWCE